MVLPLNPAALDKLVGPGSVALPVQIRETGGFGRQITLRGRSLPYRGVTFGSEQRVEITYHPGNPQAEAQVLGPEFTNTVLRGRWSDAFLSEQGNGALLIGFPLITVAGRAVLGVEFTGGQSFSAGLFVPASTQRAERARTLRDAFYMIQRGGQKLRFQWGSIVRYGHLVRFEADHDREEDIRWEMEFAWMGDADAPLRIRVSPPLDPAGLLAALIAAIQAFLDEANRVLAQILGAVALVTSKITRIASLMTDLIAMVQGFVSLALVPSQVIGTLKQAITSVLLAIRDLINTLRGLVAPYLASKQGGTPAQQNLAAAAAQAIIFQARLLGVNLEETLRKLRELEEPDVIAVEGLVAGQTLRDIARKHYGDPSSWQRIASYNQLRGSMPPAGTIVRVPR